MATVELHGVTIKEEFIVASVTTPLLSLGKLMKQGWNLHTDASGLQLCKSDKRIPIGFKRNSLCVTGNIRMLSASDDVAHLRAVEFQSSLERVGFSWTHPEHRIFIRINALIYIVLKSISQIDFSKTKINLLD